MKSIDKNLIEKVLVIRTNGVIDIGDIEILLHKEYSRKINNNASNGHSYLNFKEMLKLK